MYLFQGNYDSLHVLLPSRNELFASEGRLIDGVDTPATVEIDISKSTNSFPQIVVCFVFFAVALRPIVWKFGPRPVSVQPTGGLRDEPIQTAKAVDQGLKGFTG
jgi:hypothetical protein